MESIEKLVHAAARPWRRLGAAAAGNTPLFLGCLLTCVVVTRYIHAAYAYTSAPASAPTFCDYVINYMAVDAQVSGAWALCPAIAMLVLAAVWANDQSPAHVVAHKTWRALWLGQIQDCVAASVAVAVGGMGLCCLFAALAASGVAPLSKEAPVAPTTLVTASTMLLFFVCMFSAICFGGLRWAIGADAPAFLIVFLLAQPAVSGNNSFVYDMVRNLPGFSLFENPLHAFYSFSSVAIERWAPYGPGLRLWFLPLVSLAPVLLVWIAAPHRELLPSTKFRFDARWKAAKALPQQPLNART